MLITKTQLENATVGELEDLRDRIEVELARRELEEREPAEGRQVVEERPTSVGTLRSEMTGCGKTRCRKCGEGEGHGPYWYLYYRRGGKVISRYIGKAIPEHLQASAPTPSD